MHCAGNTLKPKWRVILAGAAGWALAGTMLIVAPSQVAATLAYTRQTGLPCGQCHENPAGGRKLTPFGKKFQENGNQVPSK
jgi:hypothetical protein